MWAFLKIKWKWKPLSCVQLFAIHGILQARILEWVAFPFSGGSSQPRDWTQVSHTAGGLFTSWATREALFGNKVVANPRTSPWSSMTGVLMGRGEDGHVVMEAEWCFNNPRCTKKCQQTPEARRGKEGFLPRGFSWSVDLPTLSFWTAGLQNDETKHSSCFEPSGLWHFVMASLRN